MRILIGAVSLIAVAAAIPVGSTGAGDILLRVDNGDFFYDRNGDCVGDTDVAMGARALRHWHVGLPFVPAAGEVAGGFGCLGGPQSWTLTVPEGETASLDGRIRYTWDTNVPGGGGNDVQLHVYDAAGSLVAGTLALDGPAPVVPMALQVREHRVTGSLGPGSYALTEDVFTGEHSAWLTRLTVTLD